MPDRWRFGAARLNGVKAPQGFVGPAGRQFSRKKVEMTHRRRRQESRMMRDFGVKATLAKETMHVLSSLFAWWYRSSLPWCSSRMA